MKIAIEQLKGFDYVEITIRDVNVGFYKRPEEKEWNIDYIQNGTVSVKEMQKMIKEIEKLNL